MFANQGLYVIIECLKDIPRPFRENDMYSIRQLLTTILVDYVKHQRMYNLFHSKDYVTNSRYMIKMLMDAILATNSFTMECCVVKLEFYLSFAICQQDMHELRPLELCLNRNVLEAIY